MLGTVAARDEALGYETYLVTGDKDAYQLVSDLTKVVTTKKGISDVVVYGPAEVEERYGVTPAQFPDFLGLKGDSSDNIPGVPGIGDKGAAKLLQNFGSIDGIYENLDKLKGKQLQNISENKEAAFTSRRVATIVRDLDFELDIEGARVSFFRRGERHRGVSCASVQRASRQGSRACRSRRRAGRPFSEARPCHILIRCAGRKPHARLRRRSRTA